MPDGGVRDRYVEELVERLIVNGLFHDVTRARAFAEALVDSLIRRAEAHGAGLPKIDRVIKVLRCMLCGAQNVEGCDYDIIIAGAAREAVRATKCYVVLMDYVIRKLFNIEPTDGLIELGKHYLNLIDMWLRGRGVDGGIEKYPAMSIVAAATMALVDAKTGDPKRTIEVLGSDKYLKGIVTRLRLSELIEWLESRR